MGDEEEEGKSQMSEREREREREFLPKRGEGEEKRRSFVSFYRHTTFRRLWLSFTRKK